MRSRLVRALLTLAAFVAVWFVVSPARAGLAAPVVPASPAGPTAPAAAASVVPAGPTAPEGVVPAGPTAPAGVVAAGPTAPAAAASVVAASVVPASQMAEADRASRASLLVSEVVNASLMRGAFQSRLAPSPLAPESEPPASRAPLCDRRGAITFAPAPQMQDLEVSLDTGMTVDDCLNGDSPKRWGHATPARAPLPIDAFSASTDAAAITAAVALAATARELLPAPVAGASRARPGIRSTVDRPPRA